MRTLRVFGLSRDITIQNNVITGPLGFGINTTGQSTTIIGNTIDGAGTGAGIQLIARHALANSNVRRNSVSNVSIALGLVQSIQAQTATSFTAKVSLNDFTSYKTAVSTLRIFPTPTATPASHYSLKSELSVGGRGNFWGPVSRVPSLCLGLLPEKVINTEDESPNAKVTDPKPYDISVAKTPLALLPLPCKPQVVGP